LFEQVMCDVLDGTLVEIESEEENAYLAGQANALDGTSVRILRL